MKISLLLIMLLSMFGFTQNLEARRLDPTTGMYMYKHRHYSPELGRFITRDPIEERGGLNVYEFVRNDSVNKIDKLGQRAATLSGKEITFELGVCGKFNWTIEFNVSPDRESKGIVLQQVTWNGYYQNYEGLVLQPEKHDISPDTNPYHEVWNVSKFERLDFPPQDTFKFGGKGVGTAGEITITGLARYYPNLSHSEKAVDEFSAIGWTTDRATNGTYAGPGQWAGEKNPGWLAAGATASSLYKHSITISWDCCDEEKNTIKERKEF